MKPIVLLVAGLLVLGGCDRGRGMETRTYELSRLSMDEAIALITPYIRDGGNVSGRNKLISVREKPDRLTLIEDLLRKYDGVGQAVDVVLDIQVVEANGFTTRDPAIADVQQTLEQTFKYAGYKLLGTAKIQAREDGAFRYASPQFQLSGRVDRVRGAGQERRMAVDIHLDVPNKGALASTVTAVVGKPVVLGQSVGAGAIILVIRASIGS